MRFISCLMVICGKFNLSAFYMCFRSDFMLSCCSELLTVSDFFRLILIVPLFMGNFPCLMLDFVVKTEMESNDFQRDCIFYFWKSFLSLFLAEGEWLLLYHSREIISDCQIHIYVIGWNWNHNKTLANEMARKWRHVFSEI